jgi:hypothetical protein
MKICRVPIVKKQPSFDAMAKAMQAVAWRDYYDDASSPLSYWAGKNRKGWWVMMSKEVAITRFTYRQTRTE